jgi:CobQ-like glutamine amidotransferase family enzyme
MTYELKIAWLYPDLMSTYGDRGNVIVLKRRCKWRNIGVTIVPVTLETSVKELTSCDLIFMGGAQDRQQKLAGEDFIKQKAPVVKKMIENDIPGLFVCAAYQFMGAYYRPYQGSDIPGAGIFDLYTRHPGDQAKRLIGNVTARLLHLREIAGEVIVGFENHGGRTYLGPGLQPFARVLTGNGNNGEDKYEGAVYNNTIGSYFHGPLLPKNPCIADWLLTTALNVKYKKTVSLPALDDAMEKQARDAIIERLT